MTLIKYENLYQVDSKGKLRFWRMENEDGKHRTVSGIVGGKEVVSGWVVCEAKNVGRSNATTPEEQASVETAADYKLKLDRKYYATAEDAQNAGKGMKFFSPMLATKWADVKKKVTYPVFSQPKLDGFRCSMSVADGPLSRGGKPFLTCAHIMKALEPAFERYPDLRLDGELYNHMFRDNFDKIQSLVTQKKPTAIDIMQAEQLVEYHVYDCPSSSSAYVDRYLFLKNEIFPAIDPFMIKLVYTTRIENEEQLDAEYAKILEDGYEGQMIRLDQEYLNGPKRDIRLVKRKEFTDAEYPVSKLEEGLGNWAGCAKAVEFILPGDLRDDQGNRPKAGCRGTKEFLKGIWERYLKGEVPTEATVRFPNFTPGGMPRFGVVTAFYYGKRDT